MLLLKNPGLLVQDCYDLLLLGEYLSRILKVMMDTNFAETML